MSRLIQLFSFSLLLVFSVASSAADSALDRIQASGQLRLGTSGNMPSMTQVDDAGKVSGLDIDMARLMASMMEVELVTKVMPFNQLLGALEAGEVDVVISNMTITQKRNLKVAFVGPYMTSGKCIVTKDEVLAKADPDSNMNVPTTRLAVLKGSTSEDVARKLFPGATVVTVEDFADAAEMVKNDQASGVLTDYPICAVTLKNNPDAGFVTLLSLLTYEPIGIALPANDAQFINWTENFLHRLNGTGALDRLSDVWLGSLDAAQ